MLSLGVPGCSLILVVYFERQPKVYWIVEDSLNSFGVARLKVEVQMMSRIPGYDDRWVGLCDNGECRLWL